MASLFRPAQLGGVFLSYRRQDTEFSAAWLYERLVGRFGREAVFKDVDSINLGDDFPEAVHRDRKAEEMP